MLPTPFRSPSNPFASRVNTKATLRVPLDSLLPLLPPIVRAPLLADPHVAPRSRDLLIHADDSRKQSENRERCRAKLFQLIARIGRENIPGETPESKRKRIEDLYVSWLLSRVVGMETERGVLTVRQSESSERIPVKREEVSQ